MADIVLINPRFEASFWGMEYAFGAGALVPGFFFGLAFQIDAAISKAIPP
jgi:hypothetical protein